MNLERMRKALKFLEALPEASFDMGTYWSNDDRQNLPAQTILDNPCGTVG